MTWRARSASDRTDDWPFWYVTNDQPQDYNRTIDAIEAVTGERPVGLPFLSKALATELAERMNAITRVVVE